MAIINKYIGPGGYFDSAPRLSQALRDKGSGASYKFLAHAWLVGLFVECTPTFPHLPLEGLDCPSPQRLEAFDRAVKRGDIVWHAFPFDAQPEVYGQEMFTWGINLTHTIDARYGVVIWCFVLGLARYDSMMLHSWISAGLLNVSTRTLSLFLYFEHPFLATAGEFALVFSLFLSFVECPIPAAPCRTQAQDSPLAA